MDAFSRYSAEGLGISKAIAYYPDCTQVSAWKSSTPLLVLQGGADDVVSNAGCKTLAEASNQTANVRFVEIPGVHHAFDMIGLPSNMKYPFGTIGYSAEAEIAAWRQVEAFLKK